MDVAPELGDDSEDFTDDEVAQALPATNGEDMIRQLREMRCPQCQERIAATKHALRRRAPFFYGRMLLQCLHQHSKSIVFRLDWLHESS
jgi:hypothetical protein